MSEVDIDCRQIGHSRSGSRCCIQSLVFAIVGTIGSDVDEEVDECICSVEAVVEDVLTAVTVEVDGCVRYRAEVSRFCLINPIIKGSHRLMDIQFGKNDDVADPFEDTFGSSVGSSLVGGSEFA